MAKNPLETILDPGSVAFLGASNNINTMGTFQLFNMIDSGFKGKVYPVHPKETKIFGHKVYPSITDLPEPVDLAVMVLPTSIVPGILDECGRKGIKHATIISGGFEETGADGARLQMEIVETAEKYGIRFTGPNCIGVCNPGAKYNNTWFPYDFRPGSIGLASQSGSYACHMFQHIKNLGAGFSKTISVGNEANIDIVDCLEYLGNDPETKCIALYIEGIRRGREFIETARRVSMKKPIVALYVGGTEAGARAGASHTAVMAGRDEVYDGAFKQSGVIRARTIDELFDWSWALAEQPPMRGDNAVVVTNSGGPGASLSDAAERCGLSVPLLPDNIVDQIKRHLPPTASPRNPVDLTFTMDVPILFFDILPNILLNSEQINGMLFYGVFSVDDFTEVAGKIGGIDAGPMKAMGEMGDAMAIKFVELTRKLGKPVVGATFYSRNEDRAIKYFQDEGIPFLPSPERAAGAMGALRARGRILDRITGKPQCAN